MVISRRNLLFATGAAVIAPSISWASDEIPPQLDHIILGCRVLEEGIRYVEKRTGVQAARGGVHPDRGTANALLSLGDRRYLEIMAPDPSGRAAQSWAARQLAILASLESPRLMGWAVHTNGIDTLAAKFRQLGIEILGPWPGSRVRPDGRTVGWKSFSLTDDRRGLLPFFIEWSAGSSHPSSDAPGGCHLERFVLAGPDIRELSNALRRIDVDAPVERAETPNLHARIIGPKGALEAFS